LLELPHGIPSHDTFGRVFPLLDPQAFGECFMRWSAALHEATKGEAIALDGKTPRHSFDTATGQSALHLVSAWASENGIALGRLKVDGKSNEITALSALLKLLGVKGRVMTTDAMGCQLVLRSEATSQSSQGAGGPDRGAGRRLRFVPEGQPEQPTRGNAVLRGSKEDGMARRALSLLPDC